MRRSLIGSGHAGVTFSIMTGLLSTTDYYVDFNFNNTSSATEVNATTAVMTFFRRKSSSSPLLWIPYILIGVSCVVFLAVHFWCYHKRNRQRYLRKREEKRVKCGLMERRRITTLMVARYQSDHDVDCIVETDLSDSINGGIFRPSDVDDDLFFEDDFYNGNSKLSNGGRKPSPNPFPPPPRPCSGGFSPSTPVFASPTQPSGGACAGRTLGFESEHDDDAFGPPQRLFPTSPPSSSSAFMDNDDDDFNLSGRFPPDSQQRSAFTDDNANVSEACTRLLIPPSEPELGGQYQSVKSDDDEEEDAASTPTTSASNRVSPFKRTAKANAAAFKITRFPNVNYSVLNQPFSESDSPSPSPDSEKTRRRSHSPRTFADLCEYEMNVCLGDSETEGSPARLKPDELAVIDGDSNTHTPDDLGIDTLKILDCEHRKDSPWRCTPPRASPEHDLDSVLELFTVDSSNGAKSKLDPAITSPPGNIITLSAQDLHQTQQQTSPDDVIVTSHPNLERLATNDTLCDNILSEKVSDFNRSSAIDDKTVIIPSPSSPCRETGPSSPQTQNKSNTPMSQSVSLKPNTTTTTTATSPTTISTQKPGSNLPQQTPSVGNGNNSGGGDIKLCNDTTGTVFVAEEDSNANRFDTSSGDNRVITSGVQPQEDSHLPEESRDNRVPTTDDGDAISGMSALTTTPSLQTPPLKALNPRLVFQPKNRKD